MSILLHSSGENNTVETIVFVKSNRYGRVVITRMLKQYDNAISTTRNCLIKATRGGGGEGDIREIRFPEGIAFAAVRANASAGGLRFKRTEMILF